MRVVPGVTSKAMSMASGYAPRAIVTPIVGAVYKKLGGEIGFAGDSLASCDCTEAVVLAEPQPSVQSQRPN